MGKPDFYTVLTEDGDRYYFRTIEEVEEFKKTDFFKEAYGNEPHNLYSRRFFFDSLRLVKV